MRHLSVAIVKDLAKDFPFVGYDAKLACSDRLGYLLPQGRCGQMHVDLMIVVRLVLLQVEETVVIVTGIASLTTCLEILLVRHHKGTVYLVLWPCCLVEVATSTLGACENHFILGSTSHCLQFKTFSNRELLDAHGKVVTSIDTP